MSVRIVATTCKGWGAAYFESIYRIPTLISDLLLKTLRYLIRASSILNKNVKLYGAMNALDVKDESSCYNSDGQSDGNTDTSFVVMFHRHVLLSEIRIQFQGGFVPEECHLFCAELVQDAEHSEITWKVIEDAFIEPEDNNELQSFDLTEMENPEERKCDAIKLQLKSSSDFYGRVTIYKLEVWGEEMEQ